MNDIRVLMGGSLVMMQLPDVPIFAAVRGEKDRWSLIGPTVMELSGRYGVRCVAVLNPSKPATSWSMLGRRGQPALIRRKGSIGLRVE
jgi:hypothetical protein